MKKCRFCAEEIQEEAVKCKHCGEFLSGSTPSIKEEEQIPWYFKKSFIIVAVGIVGPLVLPLIWWNPQISKNWKIGLTIAILVLSAILLYFTAKGVSAIKGYFSIIDEL